MNPLPTLFALPIRLCVLAWVWGGSTLARAAEAPPLPAFAVSIGSIVQMLVGLAIVVGLVFGCGWLLRRFSPQQGATGGAIRIIAGSAVGQRERVVLVEIGRTWIVLGVAPGRVNALHTMAAVAGADHGVQVRATGDSPGFAAWLKQTMERRSVR